MIKYKLPTPIGNLGLEVIEDKLYRVIFNPDHCYLKSPPLTGPWGHFSKILSEYFDRNKPIPTHHLLLKGTLFQKKVWQALTKIPYGKTVTYGHLANQLGTSPRAIGNACRQNPIPIIIPCHRVVAQNNLGGYAGFTGGEKLGIKDWLIKHEQKS